MVNRQSLSLENVKKCNGKALRKHISALGLSAWVTWTTSGSRSRQQSQRSSRCASTTYAPALGATSPNDAALPCCSVIPQVLQNILGPTPFLQAKAGIWTTTIIENILKELKEINDESAKAGQHDEEMGQLWKFAGESTPCCLSCHTHSR